MRMIALLPCLLTAALATTRARTDEPRPFPAMDDAREIMTKANDVVRSLRTVSYDVEAYVGSPQDPQALKVVGSVSIWCGDRQSAGKYRVDVEIHAKNVAVDGKLTVASNGELLFALHHTEKTFQQARSTAEMPMITQFTAPAILPEFLHPRPFGDELNGSIELVGSEDIAGEACYKILVRYERGGETAVWWIGKSDLVPRRAEKSVGSESNILKQVTTLSKLRANVDLNDELFVLSPPEGYTRPQATQPSR